MAMLQFLPWCRIEKTYDLGDVLFVPFSPRRAPEGLDAAGWEKVKPVLACYVDLQGEPVGSAALVRLRGRGFLDDVQDEDIERTRDAAEVLCFSSLAARDVFSALGPYSNSACFTRYVQRLDGDPGFASIMTRRRAAVQYQVESLAKTRFSNPIQVHAIQSVEADERLLQAIVEFEKSATPGRWERWMNGMSCFNQANTDDDGVARQVEHALLCSAFEQILEAKADANDVADRLDVELVPSRSRLAASSKRQVSKVKTTNESLRHAWMREFYRLRGDFAHGRLETKQPVSWNWAEHLVLASIALPLTARSMLSKAGAYALTDDDRLHINAFELLAGETSWRQAPEDEGTTETVWSKVQGEVSNEDFRAAIRAVIAKSKSQPSVE